MTTVSRGSIVATLNIENRCKNINLLPSVFMVKGCISQHVCPSRSTAELPRLDRTSIMSRSMQAYSIPEQIIQFQRPFQERNCSKIDEDIQTMVQMTNEKESGHNFTDEEKIQNQLEGQSDSVSYGPNLGYHELDETLAIVDETDSMFTIDKVPSIEASGLILASWIDVKELLFPKCSDRGCCEVLNCLMKKFSYPSDLRYMHPCSVREQILFLRQFKLVFEGCILVCLPEVKKRLEILQAEVEMAHLQRADKRSCSYPRNTPSAQRPETSLRRDRTPRAVRPKSADYMFTVNDQMSTKSVQIAELPHLLLPEATAESRHHVARSSLPVQFPVILHYNQEKITVPCSIITRVYPQTTKLVLHRLLETTRNLQKEQTTFTACSANQAIAFNRWITKYMPGYLHGITTGSLMITLQKFCDITFDLLPTPTFRVLQAKCKWHDLVSSPSQHFFESQREYETTQDADSIMNSYQSEYLDSALEHDCNYNAGEQACNNEQKQDIKIIPSIQDSIQSHHGQADINQEPVQNKSHLQHKAVNALQTPNATSRKETKSKLSVSASRICTKKILSTKGSRSSGRFKSPYLAQPAVINHSAFFPRRLLTSSRSSRGHGISENYSRRLQLWPKAFIAKPPNVLRVNNSCNGSARRDVFQNLISSSENLESVVQKRIQEKDTLAMPHKSNLQHHNTNNLFNRNYQKEHCISESMNSHRLTDRNISNEENLKTDTHFKSVASQDPDPPLHEGLCITKKVLQPQIMNVGNQTMFENDEVHNKDISLEQYCDTADEDEDKQEVSSEFVESIKQIDPPFTYHPVPSWKQLDLQVNKDHPYKDLYQMYDVQSPSPLAEALDYSRASSSLSAYSTPSSCSFKTGKDKLYCHEKSSPSPPQRKSSSNARSSTYTSDEDNAAVPENSSSDSSTSYFESPPLKMDNLMVAITKIQTSAPKTTIETLLGGNETETKYGDPKSVINLATDAIKANCIQNCSISQCSGNVETADDILEVESLDEDLTSQSGILEALHSYEITKTEPKTQKCIFPCDEFSNKSYIQIVTGSLGNIPENSKQPFDKTQTKPFQSTNTKKTPYKGSALKLTNESPASKKLQTILKKAQFFDNAKSLLTPGLLNISRFQSIGNVLVSNYTSSPTSSPREKSYYLEKSKEEKKVPEKTIEHIKINFPIRLQPPQKPDPKSSEVIITELLNLDMQHDTEESSIALPIEKSPDDHLVKADQNKEAYQNIHKIVHDEEVKETFDNISRPKPVSVQYNVTSTKTGTGRFFHKNTSTKLRRGVSAKHSKKKSGSKDFSVLGSSMQTYGDFQESVSSSPFQQFQDFIKSIPSETDYRIPFSSPINSSRYENCVHCESENNSIKNYDTKETKFLTFKSLRPNSRHNIEGNSEQQLCSSCQDKKHKPLFKYTRPVPGKGPTHRQGIRSSSPKKPTVSKLDDSRFSVVSVHDSVSKPLSVTIKNKAFKISPSRPVGNRRPCFVPLINKNRLEDNLSITSLYSPSEDCQHPSKLESENSTRRKQTDTGCKDVISKVSMKEKESSNTDLANISKQEEEDSSSNVVNVVFQYEQKPVRKHNHENVTVSKQSQNESTQLLTKHHDKYQAKYSARNSKHKLRICIDLVGSSEDETS